MDSKIIVYKSWGIHIYIQHAQYQPKFSTCQLSVWLVIMKNEEHTAVCIVTFKTNIQATLIKTYQRINYAEHLQNEYHNSWCAVVSEFQFRHHILVIVCSKHYYFIAIYRSSKFVLVHSSMTHQCYHAFKMSTW